MACLSRAQRGQKQMYSKANGLLGWLMTQGGSPVSLKPEAIGALAKHDNTTAANH